MKCLVCHQLIVIKRFQELFVLKSPLLCCHCRPYFIQKKEPCLFEKNEWIIEVIQRLEKGDLILLKLLIPSYYQEIKRQLKLTQTITILRSENQGPYPWIEVLLEEVMNKFSQQEKEKIHLKFTSSTTEFSNVIRIC